MNTRSVLQRAKRSARDEGNKKQLLKDKKLSLVFMGVITRIDDRVNAPIAIIENDDGTFTPLGGIR